MTKKIIISIIFATILVAVALCCLFYVRIYNENKFPDRTGAGIITLKNPEEIQLGKAINNLQKSLPVSTTSFSITKYDYSKGKFVVIPYNGTPNLQADFDTWYSTSTFSGVPKSMFLMK